MKISVVIPCYNKEPFLAETLGSVLSQTLQPAEILLIDDGSTDASAEVARRFEPDVTLLPQENAGMSAARNRGIREATGEWVALLDADDLWEREKLERQVAALADAPQGTVCVYTDMYYFGEHGRREEVRPEHHVSESYVVDMLLEWPLQPSSALIRRDAALETPFPEQYRDSEDVIFFASLRRLGPFLRVPEPLTGYRQGHTQQTRDPHHFYRAVRARHEWFEAHADEFSVPADERDRLRSGLARQLVAVHNSALWDQRDIDLVRACRRLFDELDPGLDQRPASLSAFLWPRWVYRVRDGVRRALTGPVNGQT